MKTNRGRIGNNSTLEGLQSQLNRLKETVDHGIEFGNPGHPIDPSRELPVAGLPGAAQLVNQHNGVIDNIHGSWVENYLTSRVNVKNILWTHNLYRNDPDYVLPVSGEPNVRWLNFGTYHDGFVGSSNRELYVNISFIGGAVNSNAIFLRCWPTAAGSTLPNVNIFHPIKMTLFFTKAIRGE